ncbi:MAG: flp pilus-assembly TadE/G-like family protein [Actinomycetaceae bacterium]|nr:flp pilus-assembly TadE/G-like family protein [Actinomycetaceae bacterium]
MNPTLRHNLEKGQITVMMAVIIAAVCFLITIVISLAGIYLARIQAQNAADFAALSAANSAYSLTTQNIAPCKSAAMVASSHGGHIHSCRSINGDYRVEVTMPIFFDTTIFTLTARARAGPIGSAASS